MPELDAVSVRDLRDRGVIAGGMIPKTDACLLAAGLGVRSQIIDDGYPEPCSTVRAAAPSSPPARA